MEIYVYSKHTCVPNFYINEDYVNFLDIVLINCGYVSVCIYDIIGCISVSLCQLLVGNAKVIKFT